MSIHRFTLLLDGPALSEEDIGRLFEAGCDDAAFGLWAGSQAASFDREDATLAAAVVSGIQDIEATVPEQRVVRVELEEPVTLAEIAERTGRSREGIRSLATGKRGPGGFPAPRPGITGKVRMWLWSEVAAWFYEHFGETVGAMSQSAHFVAAVNGTLEARRQLAELSDLVIDREVMGDLAQTRDALKKL